MEGFPVLKVNHNKLYRHEYSLQDVIPVLIQSVDSVTIEEKSALISKYEDSGFVIFELSNDFPDQKSLLKIASEFKLGIPFVPSIYNSQKDIYQESGVNYISVKDGTHRAFQTNGEQQLHSDGTLERIGRIKTTILLCQSQASSGGETRIFNSVGAFYGLFNKNECSNLAYALMNPYSLRRVAVNGKREEAIGPAFLIEGKELISRFSIDNTSDWQYGFKRVKNLHKAYDLMVEQISNKSPYYLETKLEENQGIIIANHKISHGRNEYEDMTKKRTMIRGLFEKELR
jgi:hypothetical protein